MAKVSVYNIEGKVVGDIELNDAVFGVEVNKSSTVDRWWCCIRTKAKRLFFQDEQEREESCS